MTDEVTTRRRESPARQRGRRMDILRRRRDHLANVIKEHGDSFPGCSWTKAEHAALVWAIQVLEDLPG